MPLTAVATNQLVAKILREQNLLPAEVLDGLLQKAKKRQEWIGYIAVADGFLSYDELADALARETKCPRVNLRTFAPDSRALESLSATESRTHGVIPLTMQRGKLVLAMANPLDESCKELLRQLARCELIVQVAPYDAILSTAEEWYAKLPTLRPPDNTDELRQLVSDLRFPGEMITPRMELVHPSEQICLEDLLIMMMERRASDLHFTAGSAPLIRVDGQLQSMPFPVLVPHAIQTIVYSILTDVQITNFERCWELDFSYSLPGISRFRVNLHRQRGSVGAVFRIIPMEVPTLDKLHMPAIVRELTRKPRGLVLITGPTGSGKSTTLAAMVEEINRATRLHIVTIEDPIEFLHSNQMSVVTQREVGSDTESFAVALRHVLRQDPDVILVGEMRDLETISTALTAAETGHLVLASLHTTSAAQTIDRITDVFPETQQGQVRAQLANVLEGIVTQALLPRNDGKGRVCAQEIMVASPAIRTLIRDNKVHQMPSVIQASAKYGMQTLDTALRNLVTMGQVSLDEALRKTSNPDDFKAMVAMQ